MKHHLRQLFKGHALTQNEAREVMTTIMDGEASPEQIAGFLGSLAARGETSAELVGCVQAMRAKAKPFVTKRRDLIDVCGTGGDDLGTFNISTTNALLLAAAGLGVVKHGNRAISSQSGSADLLEKLGIDISGERLEERLDHLGFVFLFAPHFHPAMKHVAPVRSALGLRTIFNLLGPLANPAPVKRQVIGVYEERLVSLLAKALLELGTEDALIVCGRDGLDELSLSTSTLCARIRNETIQMFELTPEEFGLERSPVESLQGGTSEENAEITRQIFSGIKGPKRDVVVMNAAAALHIAGLAASWQSVVSLAESIIDSGQAAQKLKDIRGFSL